jgi:hypothetical protein
MCFKQSFSFLIQGSNLIRQDENEWFWRCGKRWLSRKSRENQDVKAQEDANPSNQIWFRFKSLCIHVVCS